MDKIEFKFSGYGGQGIITMSKLIAKGALLYENKEVIQTEAYGAAARGGSCWAEVVVSDEKINYPRAQDVDYLVVLTTESATKFKGTVKKDGQIFIDPGLVSKYRAKKGQKLYEIPASNIAKEEFNLPVVGNVVMFGAIVAVSKIMSKENAIATVKSSVPPKVLDTNLKALERGFQVAEELMAKME